jgi:chromosomal replication initiation ATPase DnaA
MGCDYYIDKDLEIYDSNDKMFSSINLEHEKRYYWFSTLLDEDEDGYDTEYAEYIKQTLEPTMKPIVIYSDNSFTKLSFENKYKKLIENEIKICNKTFNDVSKILKIEHRYER